MQDLCHLAIEAPRYLANDKCLMAIKLTPRSRFEPSQPRLVDYDELHVHVPTGKATSRRQHLDSPLPGAHAPSLPPSFSTTLGVPVVLSAYPLISLPLPPLPLLLILAALAEASDILCKARQRRTAWTVAVKSRLVTRIAVAVTMLICGLWWMSLPTTPVAFECC